MEEAKTPMEREYPADSRLQKMIGKSWSSWNLPEQPTEIGEFDMMTQSEILILVIPNSSFSLTS